MKVNFIRKATTEELIPQDEYVIEKIVTIDKEHFDHFISNPLQDYDFISKNLDHMYCDKSGVFHCLFITSDEHDFGILVESEGHNYARYVAYLPKVLLSK